MMFFLSKVFHIHDWNKEPIGDFALLPKMNLQYGSGMKGIVQKCNTCEAKRFLHPKLTSVEVTEMETKTLE